MSAWSLPTTATVDGKETPIRSDFRAVLDALAALDDLDLTMPERAAACVRILYPEWKDMLHVVGNYELNIANYGEDWFGLSSVANDYNPNICNQYMKIGDTAKSFHLQIPFSFNGTAYFNWRFLTFHKMYISQIYVV